MKKAIAMLGVVLVMANTPVSVFANSDINGNEVSTVETTSIITPQTSYDWTQAVWISAYQTTQFKGPAGNNYLFNTVNFPEDNHYPKFVFTWDSGPEDNHFTIKAIHTDGTSVSSSGRGASGTLTLSRLKRGQYRVEVTNNRGVDMGMMLNLETAF